MTNIFIDPIIVATPPENADRGEIEKWLKKLEIWLNEALTTPHGWFFSAGLIAQLQSSNRFPTISLLRRWQRKFQFDNERIEPILKNVAQFFRNEADLELEAKLGFFVIAEENSVTIKPEEFVTRWTDTRWLDEIQAETISLLVSACACKQLGETFASELSIATLPLTENTRQIEVAATVAESEPEFEWGGDRNISQTFPLLFTLDDLLPSDSLADWDDLEKCVKTHFRNNPGMQSYPGVRKQPLPFECTAKFWKTIRQNCRTAQLREALIAALTKRLYGIFDKGLGDEELPDKRRFRITDYWRVHYQQQDGKLIIEEFVQHDVGLKK